jgi:Cu-Zn family superoxide dismutase
MTGLLRKGFLGGAVVAGVSAMLAVSAPAVLAAGGKAAASLKSKDGQDVGTISILETSGGALVKIKLKGLPPGPHGLAVHEFGKCEGDFSSAGGIHNPFGAKHGFFNEEGPMAGDLPNLIVPANGEVELELLTPHIALAPGSDDSVFDADGSAIVIHEAPDDYLTEPDGNAGPPIACGVLMP